MKNYRFHKPNEITPIKQKQTHQSKNIIKHLSRKQASKLNHGGGQREKRENLRKGEEEENGERENMKEKKKRKDPVRVRERQVHVMTALLSPLLSFLSFFILFSIYLFFFWIFPTFLD